MFNAQASAKVAAANERNAIHSAFGLLPVQLMQDPTITPFAKLTYAMLSYRQNEYHHLPSRIRDLAALLHASPNGVRTALRALRKRGWVAVEKDGRQNHYELNRIPCPPLLTVSRLKVAV